MVKVCSYDNFYVLLTSHHIIWPIDTWHKRATANENFRVYAKQWQLCDGRHFSCRDELTNFRNSALIRRTGKTRLAAFSSTRNAFMAARSSNKLEERGRSTQLFSTFFSTGPPHATGPSSPLRVARVHLFLFDEHLSAKRSWAARKTGPPFERGTPRSRRS